MVIQYFDWVQPWFITHYANRRIRWHWLCWLITPALISIRLCVAMLDAMLGDEDLVRHTHSHFHSSASFRWHVYGLICSNALFWHLELPVLLYLHLSRVMLSILHSTATVITAYPLSWAFLAVVVQCLTPCVKCSWPHLVLHTFFPAVCQRRATLTIFCLYSRGHFRGPVPFFIPSALVPFASSLSAPTSLSFSPSMFPSLLSF